MGHVGVRDDMKFLFGSNVGFHWRCRFIACPSGLCV